MGVMEQILEQLKQLNEKIDNLPAAVGGVETVLIDGKAALDAKELADYLGVSAQVIREQSRQGRIPFVEVASKRVYPVAIINQWLAEESSKNYIREKELDTSDIFKLTG